jgi:hypothetical protein
MSGEGEDSLLDSLTASVEAEKAENAAKDAPKDEVSEETKGEEDNEEVKADADIDENADTDGEHDDIPAKPTKRSAADEIRKLKAERNEERAEREKLIAERATYAAQLEHLRQQKDAEKSAADRKAEEDRLALLDPTERAAYSADKRAQQLEHRLNLMQMQMQDNTDKAIFRAKAAHDPLVAKYAEQVEQMLQDDVKKGFSAPRDTYLQILVGKAVIENSAKELSKKKAAASKRIDTVTGKSASARGDVAGSKKGSSEEDRLRGQLI